MLIKCFTIFKNDFMKKSLFLASILTIGVLSSCSTESESLDVTNNGMQKVLIGVNQPVVSVSQTRGTGTVGSIVDSAANIWKGEELYMIMVGRPDKNIIDWTWGYSKADGLGEIFANEKVIAPNGLNKGYITTSSVKYYPPTGAHDFFAYRIDDAAVNGAGGPIAQPLIKTNAENNQMKVAFKIDGSQDLMVGKAKYDETYLGQSFSSYTARQGVQPSITFKHLLTRFTINLRAGDESSSDLEVTAIKIVSKSSGDLLVAYTEDQMPTEFITWSEANSDTLSLKEVGDKKLLQPLTPFKLSNDLETGDYITAGEAIMVAPGEKEYQMIITTKQILKDGTPYEYTTLAKISSATIGTFQPGTSYKINVTLYGLHEARVEAVLTGWLDGGSIDLVPGNNGFE